MAKKVSIRSLVLPDGEARYGYHKLTISDGVAEVSEEVANELLQTSGWARLDDKEAEKRAKSLNPRQAEAKAEAAGDKERMQAQAEQLAYNPDDQAETRVDLSNRVEGGQ